MRLNVDFTTEIYKNNANSMHKYQIWYSVEKKITYISVYVSLPLKIKHFFNLFCKLIQLHRKMHSLNTNPQRV